MKVLVALYAISACAVAAPLTGYAYTVVSPPATLPYAYTHQFDAPYNLYDNARQSVPMPPSASLSPPSPTFPVATPTTVTFAPAPTVAATSVPVGIKTQFFVQDNYGQVRYGFSEPKQAQTQVQDAAGNKVGSFSYVNPEGKLVQTNYVADALGYRVTSNDLPTIPMVQPVHIQDNSEDNYRFFPESEQAKTIASQSLPVQTPASTVAVPVAVAAPAPVVYARAPAPVTYDDALRSYAASPYVARYAYTEYPFGYSVYANLF